MAQLSGTPPILSPRVLASATHEGGDPGSSIDNIIVTPLPDGILCWAVSQKSLYVLDKLSAQVESFPDVLSAVPAGKWIRLSPYVPPEPPEVAAGNTLIDGAYKEVLPSGNAFWTSYIWWTSVAKLQKILEQMVTRNPSGLPTQIVTKYYDAVGVLSLIVTDDITYDNMVESTRTRTIG